MGNINGKTLVGNINVATTPNITIGTTITLEEGQEATVMLDKTSTRRRPVFNFGIPKGESAYTSACKEGYMGSIEEFYLTLGNVKNVNAGYDSSSETLILKIGGNS